jgi:hypothetical protein
MNSLTRFSDWNSIAGAMLIVILRSICAGIAAIFVEFGIGIFIGLPVALYLHSRSAPTISNGSGEVGWDLVTMAHNSPLTAVLIPLVAFGIGFSLGFRYFSRSLAKN